MCSVRKQTQVFVVDCLELHIQLRKMVLHKDDVVVPNAANERTLRLGLRCGVCVTLQETQFCSCCKIRHRSGDDAQAPCWSTEEQHQSRQGSLMYDTSWRTECGVGVENSHDWRFYHSIEMRIPLSREERHHRANTTNTICRLSNTAGPRGIKCRSQIGKNAACVGQVSPRVRAECNVDNISTIVQCVANCSRKGTPVVSRCEVLRIFCARDECNR